MREHRLYQADWLMRFYGFERKEITAAREQAITCLTGDQHAPKEQPRKGHKKHDK